MTWKKWLRFNIIIAILIIIFIVIKYYSSSTKSNSEIIQTTEIDDDVNQNNFIKFDEIVHYKLDENTRFISNPKTKNDSLINNIIIYDKPINLSDNDFINSLKQLNLTKNEVNRNNYSKIRSIILYPETANYANACEPMYRDVLLFKNKSKVVGIIKICFECDKDYNVGFPANIKTHNNVSTVEQYNELQKLINEQF